MSDLFAKLSFSTLGCPEWGLDEVIRWAVQCGYDGIAFRGLHGQLEFGDIPEFSKAGRPVVLERLTQAGLRANMISSSTRLLAPDAEAREQNRLLAEYDIDLASDLECPYVRVFGGAIRSGVSFSAAVRQCAEQLRELADYAAPRGVNLLIETHDDWIVPALMRRVAEAAAHPNIGVLWDVHHTFRTAETPIEDAWRELGRFVQSVDLKDSARNDASDTGADFKLIGEGDIPIHEVLSDLYAGGYHGWITFEWEKYWHPEIEEPEIAVPQFMNAITTMMTDIQREAAG